MKRIILGASALLCACSAQPEQGANNLVLVGEKEAHVPSNSTVPGPVTSPRPATNAAANDREIVSEGPIDPGSAQGAGQVVQTYFALVEAGKFADARKLWGPAAAQASELSAYREYHAEIFKPNEPEGAAGSIYVTVPVRAYGVTARGEKFEEPQVVTLRRVNDIDGSTPEQRRWHITRIDTPPSPH